MKQQEIMLNTHINEPIIDALSEEEIGDDHLFTGLNTPMKSDAFALSDLEKKRKNFKFICSNNGCNGT